MRMLNSAYVHVHIPNVAVTDHHNIANSINAKFVRVLYPLVFLYWIPLNWLLTYMYHHITTTLTTMASVCQAQQNQTI